MLLFYDPLGSQWLCRSDQFSPHLILFYCTLAALLLGNSGGWRRQENLGPVFPRESSNGSRYKKGRFPQSHKKWHHSKYTTLCFTVSFVMLGSDANLKCVCGLWCCGWCFYLCLQPVGVCTCDRAPHCCSDVSSLCLRPRSITPGPLVFSWGWVSLGFPFSLLLHLPPPPALLTPAPPSPNLHSGRSAESSLWPLAASDHWLNFELKIWSLS